MSRIKDLQKQVHKVLGKMGDGDKRSKAVAHLHGVALAASVLAKKRGENAELAAMAGLLHDLYAYKSGSYDDHAHLGAEYARKLLNKLGMTTDAETEVICSAIWHHDGKAETDGPMDEILKDADVIDHSLSDPTKEVKPHERERCGKLCAELGLTD
ncbi:MAG: HD domain-containing protein [Clostridia bacterium]|nr:HD domain-containing protein [Clostridia bacterium]